MAALLRCFASFGNGKIFHLHPQKLAVTNILINSNLSSRHVSTTSQVRGLEEFFPPGVYDGENLVEEEPIVGRRWKASELRARSNGDLHKLWYVLLKERNMLLTMRHECKRLSIQMPGPTRLHKVQKSMAMVKVVINERERAVRDLEHYQFSFDREHIADASTETASSDTTSSEHNSADFHRDNIEPVAQKTVEQRQFNVVDRTLLT